MVKKVEASVAYKRCKNKGGVAGGNFGGLDYHIKGTEMNKKEIDIYTAGLFDGEGSITLILKNKTSVSKTPVIIVVNTEYDLLSFLKTNYKGYISKRAKPKNPLHSQTWQWALDGNKAISFLKEIFPYLKDKKKKHRATLLINKYQKCVKRGKGLTTEDYINNDIFYNRFFCSEVGLQL